MKFEIAGKFICRIRAVRFFAVVIFMVMAFVLSGGGTASAAEIRIPPLKAAPGQQIEVPVIIHGVDNLAGMKIVFGYDSKALRYESTAKAKEAASLIHIVNDKRPGLLIAVMAGARGIKAEELAILTFTFKVSPKASPGTTLSFRITESQLMSDKLKDLDHQVNTSVLAIIEEHEPTATPGRQ